MNTTSSFEKYNLEKHPSEKNNFETVYKSNKSNSTNYEDWFKSDKEKEDINTPPASKKTHISRIDELNAKLDEYHAQNKSNSFVLTKKKREMLLKNQKKLKNKKKTKKYKKKKISPISYDYTVLASPKVVKKTRRRPLPRPRVAWKPTGKALKIRLG